MKVTDLKLAMNFIVAEYQKNKIDNLFQQFINVLSQNQRQRNQAGTPVFPHRDELFKALTAIDFTKLPIGQKTILQYYNAYKYFGPEAVDEIMDFLKDDHYDPFGSQQKVQAHFQNTKNLFTIANNLVSSLQPFSMEAEVPLEAGSALFQITFANKAEVNNFVSLKDAIDDWQVILRSFGSLYGVRPEDFSFANAHKNSPFVLEVIAVSGAIIAMGKAANAILDTLTKYYTIKKMQSEIKSLNLKNSQLEKELEKEDEKFKKAHSEEIAKVIISEIDKKLLKDNELKNGISISIEKLFVFLSNGGKVDCIPSAKDPEEIKKIEEVFSSTRALEGRIEDIRQITYKNGESM